MLMIDTSSKRRVTLQKLLLSKKANGVYALTARLSALSLLKEKKT
jgi:hypothetical protein